ncbi:putative zingipain [Helianthus annuus]|nr:putative zingipain [Helianthus annuus]
MIVSKATQRFQAPCEDIDSINHTITIVGYGREDDVDYWIIKNSWGTDWGEQGFMRLGRNVNSYGGNCGIMLEVYCPIKKGLHVPKFAIWSIGPELINHDFQIMLWLSFRLLRIEFVLVDGM